MRISAVILLFGIIIAANARPGGQFQLPQNVRNQINPYGGAGAAGRVQGVINHFNGPQGAAVRVHIQDALNSFGGEMSGGAANPQLNAMRGRFHTFMNRFGRR